MTETLTVLEARNAGKPIGDARGAMGMVCDVFADADLEAAATAAPGAVFGSAGQDCCARSRILVQRSAVERFLSLLKPVVTGIRVGDPLDPASEMGPLISARQRARVESYLDDGGAVAIRGSAPEGPGFWCAPAVLSPVAPDARAAREEIFGPVAVVIPFEDGRELGPHALDAHTEEKSIFYATEG